MVARHHIWNPANVLELNAVDYKKIEEFCVSFFPMLTWCGEEYY